MTTSPSEPDLRLGLSLLSREDLEEAHLRLRAANEAIRERMRYWMERCLLAERAVDSSGP